MSCSLPKEVIAYTKIWKDRVENIMRLVLFDPFPSRTLTFNFGRSVDHERIPSGPFLDRFEGQVVPGFCET
jgi:hypothetical protein